MNITPKPLNPLIKETLTDIEKIFIKIDDLGPYLQEDDLAESRVAFGNAITRLSIEMNQRILDLKDNLSESTSN